MVKQMEKWAELKGYAIVDEVVISTGLPYLLGYSYLQTNSVYQISIPIAGEWDKRATKEFGRAMKGHKGFAGIQFLKKQGILLVSVKSPMMGGVEKLFAYLEDITTTSIAALQNLGIKSSDTCNLCKKPGADTHTTQGIYAAPAHSQCLADKASKELNKIKGGGNIAATGSRSILAIVLAFVFAIGGYFLAALVIFSVDLFYLITMPIQDYLVDILFILLPFLAMAGYKVGVGQYRPMRVVPIVTVTLVSTLVLDLILEYIGLVSEFGITLSVSEFMELVNHPQVRPYVIKDMVLPFVFVAVGIVIAYFTSLRKSNAALQETAKNLAKAASVAEGADETASVVQDSVQTASPAGDDRFVPRDFGEFTPENVDDRFSRPAEDFAPAAVEGESQLPDPEIK